MFTAAGQRPASRQLSVDQMEIAGDRQTHCFSQSHQIPGKVLADRIGKAGRKDTDVAGLVEFVDRSDGFLRADPAQSREHQPVGGRHLLIKMLG